MNITSVYINFPSYNGLVYQWDNTNNFLEADNGKGKTTVFDTIISMFTDKFGTKSIPNGTATIKFENGEEAILMDGIWFLPDNLKKIKQKLIADGNQKLARYIRVGDFFDMIKTTPDQRQAITDLLGLDKESYMRKIIPDWHHNSARDLRALLKVNQGKESVILNDISYHKFEVIKYQKYFEEQGLSTDDLDSVQEDYQQYIDEYNSEVKINMNLIDEIYRENLLSKQKSNDLQNQIDIHNKKLDLLRENYNRLITNTCSCGAILNSNEDELNAQKQKLKEEAEEVKESLHLYESSLGAIIIKPSPKLLPSKTVKEIVESNGLVYKSQEEFNTIKSKYKFALEMLERKEKELLDINLIDIDAQLKLIDNANKDYTLFLERAITCCLTYYGITPLLFTNNKSGDSVETFSLQYKGVDMKDLSNGHKIYCMTALANMFSDKLGIPYVILDEAGTLSKNTYDSIVNQVDTDSKQMLFARATLFSL